jgi:hypothetical protein
VALRFGREFRDQERDGDGADDRNEDDARAPGRGRREQVGIVANCELPEKQQVVKEADQVAKQHRTEPGDHAHHERQHAEKRQADAPCLVVTPSIGRAGCCCGQCSALPKSERALTWKGGDFNDPRGLVRGGRA